MSDWHDWETCESISPDRWYCEKPKDHDGYHIAFWKGHPSRIDEPYDANIFEEIEWRDPLELLAMEAMDEQDTL